MASRKPVIKAEPEDTNTPKLDPKYVFFRLRLAHSKIHRWGVYAAEVIPVRRKVMEYTGERINRRETKKRAERQLNYLFTLDPYWTIDGSAGGSGAQFINHSCEPNLVARVIRGHILYFALREIKRGEELTLDYNFAKDVDQVVCQCGTANCRGTINLK